MRKAISIASIFILLVAVLGGMGGCAPTQIVKPETVPQKLFYAYGLIDGVASSVETLYRSRVLSDKETEDALQALQEAWNALNTAEKLYAIGKEEQYKADLDSALKIVSALQEFMLERGKQ
jgi:hypothetical protein